MSALSWFTTLALFQTPERVAMESNSAERREQNESVRLLPYVVPAFGSGALFAANEFKEIWTALLGESPHAPTCGRPKVLTGSDRALVVSDQFLVAIRGFSPELCLPSSWYISSMRLDPCRVRLGRENKTMADLQRCAQNGKFSEIRFVLQPVLKHDRGYFFPDAALHAAFSFRDFSKAIALWRSWNLPGGESRWSQPQAFFDALRKGSFPNEVSLFISGAGQERWTFSRVVHGKGQWNKDKLAQGGFHESLTDAEPAAVGLRTPPAAGVKVFSTEEFLDPLRSTPLQGSCVGCHLASPGRAARAFRHFGWGLSGEAIISPRVRSEAAFASRELQLFLKASPRQ